jgi:SAM-dependent methyltransferase
MSPVRATPPASPFALFDYWTPFIVRLLVEHGVCEAFGRDPRSVDDVAAETDTDADAVRRMIRVLESRGVFERVDGDQFRLTPLGRRLLHDEPGSIAGLANFKPYELHAWAEAPHTLRTGEAAFSHYFGESMWEWLEERPAASAQFNDTMRRRTSGLLNTAMPEYEWPDDGTVVDVGGGNGLLLERLLAHRPAMRGVVFDLPHVVSEAEARLNAAGLAERVEVVGGDFFADAIPADHHIYVMANVLHDWTDADSVRILQSVHRALGADSRLLLFESVLGDDDSEELGKMVDLHMMVLLGAKERTAAEWRRLLRDGGFEVTRIVPTAVHSWIEARAATAP